jgi:hypothetical protein
MEENFRYVSAVDALRSDTHVVARQSTAPRRLPGIYPDSSPV